MRIVHLRRYHDQSNTTTAAQTDASSTTITPAPSNPTTLPATTPDASTAVAPPPASSNTTPPPTTATTPDASSPAVTPPASSNPSTSVSPTPDASSSSATTPPATTQTPPASTPDSSSATPSASTPTPPATSSDASSNSSPAASSNTSASTESPPQSNGDNSGSGSSVSLFGFGVGGTMIEVIILLVILLIIALIIYYCYKKIKANRQYNQTPQHFSNKPNLGIKASYTLNNTQFEPITNGENIKITNIQTYEGRITQIQFKGTEDSMVYFHRRQKQSCYYQVEFIVQNANIQFGYVHVQLFQKLKDNGDVGNLGFSINSYGYMQLMGQNLQNYNFSLQYGDTIGIGITKQKDKQDRRGWISRNGALCNPPPSEQIDKWISSIKISEQEKKSLQKSKNQLSLQISQDKNALKQQQQKEKQLLKRRVIMPAMNNFQYYPVIFCEGNKSQNKTTVINVNVGGQIFRMNDLHFRDGLLG